MKFSLLILILLPLLTALGGCMSAKEIPQDHYYQLPSHTTSLPQDRLCQGVLGVAHPQVAGLLNERALLTIDGQRPLEIVPARYHFWQETPASLVQHDLVWYLSKRGVAGQVIFYQPGQSVNTLLLPRILALVSQHDGSRYRVLVRIKFTVTKETTGTPLFRKVYEKQHVALGPGSEQQVAAFGAALVEIYEQLITDLTQIKDDLC